MQSVLEAMRRELRARERAVRDRLEAGLKEALNGAMQELAEPPALDPDLLPSAPAQQPGTTDSLFVRLQDALERLIRDVHSPLPDLLDILKRLRRLAGRLPELLERLEAIMTTPEKHG